MPNIQAFADAISTTFTAAEITAGQGYDLGALRYQTDQEVQDGGSGVSSAVTWAKLKGERTWIFVTAGSAIKVGDVVIRSSGTPFTGVPCAADAAEAIQLLGVADHAIASGSSGWSVQKGCCVVRSDTSGGGKSISANVVIDTDGSTGAAGEVATIGAANLGAIGLTLEAASATLADFVQAYVDVG